MSNPRKYEGRPDVRNYSLQLKPDIHAYKLSFELCIEHRETRFANRCSKSTVNKIA